MLSNMKFEKKSKNMFQFLLLFTGVIVTVANPMKEPPCRISIDLSKGDLVEPQPLILTDTDEPNFILPTEKDDIIIPGEQTFLLACPGTNNSLDSFGSTQVLQVKCLKNNTFLIDRSKYNFHSFKCKKTVAETIKKSNSPCLDKHTKYEIGYEIEDHFLKLLEVCRDEITYRTYYSRHTIVKEINSRQSGYPRPEWKTGDYYSQFDVDYWYKFKSERENLQNLLGSEELAKKYIYYDKQNPISEWQMFHKGHLAAKADFIYGPHQWTTFWLLNTNPQWGSFNSGNWLYLENSVRSFAPSRQMDLDVYTGVHGIASLRDINNNEQPLYLYVNGTEKFLPIPRYFWKIIHDPISKRATAFVGMNQPYVDDFYEDMYICPDISDDYDFSWLSWDPANIELGISYVCTVESLREVVPTIPEIGEKGLLT